jgi:hypothetical protein
LTCGYEIDRSKEPHMILVRTNPKLAIAIVCATLLTSLFTVYMVTRSTDRAVQQGVELQRESTKSVDDAIRQSSAAAKSQPGVSDDVQAQIDAAQKQIEDAAK